MCLSQLILFAIRSYCDSLYNNVINIALLAFEQVKKRFFARTNVAQAFDKKHVNRIFNNFKHSFSCRCAFRERLSHCENNYQDSNSRVNVFLCFRFCFNYFVCFFSSYHFCRFRRFVCFYYHYSFFVCFRRCYCCDNFYFRLFFFFSS